MNNSPIEKATADVVQLGWMGRGDRRKKRVVVYFSDGELAALEGQAEQRGMPLAVYLRSLFRAELARENVPVDSSGGGSAVQVRRNAASKR